MSAGSSNRASGFISYDNDIQTENIGARIDEDLARHLPTWRTISSPGETRLSINLYAPLYFSSSSGHRRYLVLPAIRIGLWLQVWGHALHTRDTLLRALTFREHETSFHHVEHHFDYVCATTTIAAKCKTRCPPRDVVRSRMPGHLATGIKNRSYISVRVYAKLFLGETATENPFYWMLLSARSLSHLRITALLNQFPYSRDNVVRGRQRERRKLNLSNERWYLIRPRERISKYA